MRRFILLFVAAILSRTTTQSISLKRGLCHVASKEHPGDDHMWTTGPSNPTWYYNYGHLPSPSYTSNHNMQFVPMLWGASDKDSGRPFYDDVKRQLDAGVNISHVLTFNEPDATHAVGGSDIQVDLAVIRWKAEIEPLRKLGVKVGAPAVTGGANGWTWLESWFKMCGVECNPDFMTVHWYGNFEGMMSHVGQVTAKWPHMSVWVTEYGYPNQDVHMTQEFLDQSVQTFDRWPNITHYAYFGAFRSDVSNIGPNAAMLSVEGDFTNIGRLYMGREPKSHNDKSSKAHVVRVYRAKTCIALFVSWMLLV